MAQYSPIQNSKPLHLALLGSAVAAMLATAGCGGSPPPPPASYGADLSSTEMMAARGDPYANQILTPAQRQRVSTYQVSHPEITPTWTRDAGNLAMGAGGGFLAGRSWSDARAAKTIGGTAEAAGAVEGAAAGEGTAAARPAALVGETVTSAGERAAITEGATALGGRAAVTEGAAAVAGRAAVTDGAAALVERFTVGEIVAGVACFAIIHFCP